ncbi:proteasomal ATPase-associated factor 1-like isoform X2 [Ptychodera flava]|uniref:proteasomal ATPase-associated factor 1-like isoform X2 n=1 Tax=Ptychodera flava TaxID=63121 RepID=UPI003969DBC2
MPINKMAARMIVQCDWDEALRESEGHAWISFNKIGQPSVQGELKSQGVNANNIPVVVASEGFRVDAVSEKSLVVTYTDEPITAKFISPAKDYQGLHNKSIVSVDVSSGGALGVSAADDGKLLVWQTSDGAVRREFKGHVGDVNCCQFFPSGVVVLSGGSDMQLKIWSVEDGSCPVTLRGHTAGITDTAIVDKGRNIVSCARDGMAKLWDCGRSACLDTVAKCGCPINGCNIGVANNAVNLGTPQNSQSEREIGTEGKLLLLAREDGVLQGIGLHSRQSVFEFNGSAAFNCCASLSSTHVIGGTQDGHIYILDIRNTSAPYREIQKSRSPVLCLLSHNNRFIASTGDGTCYSVNPENMNQTEEFTGPDCDPVYGLAVHNETLYTACRDMHIRKYAMS